MTSGLAQPRGAFSIPQQGLRESALLFQSGWCLSSVILLAAHFMIRVQRIFRKSVTRAHAIIHTVDFLELCNTLECFLAKGNLTLKSMQSYSLEQVTKGYVEISRKRFENLHHSLFHS